MIIRELKKEDAGLISNLFDKDFKDGWTQNMLISSFEGGRFLCFGAFVGKRLVGVITSTKSYDDADIESVVVDGEFRQKGIASELIEELIKGLLEDNIKKIFLEVRSSNYSAISLYKKHNFNQISLRKKYYADGEDAIIFMREI